MIELCPARQLAGNFENLKGRVLSSLNGRAEAGFVVAFTSCEESEGVTSTSVNFAASLASQGERNVLLIDGDLKRPELHHYFEKKEKKQAPDETQGEANLVWRTLRANRNLDVLLVRQRQDNPMQVFETALFKKRLGMVRERYDCVVIDCPPLNEANGAMVLAGRADAVILVVEAERVRREVIQRALSVLEDSGAHVLGVVLNKRRYPIPRFIYKML